MNREEAIKKSTEYFGGDVLAAGVFVDKYALTTPEGDVLEGTPDDMHKRLAKEFARIEKKYPNSLSEEEIYKYLSSWEIVPQGSPMSVIGNPYQLASLSNCFVISNPGDSYGNIFKADQELAQIMKRRGGCLEENTKVVTEDKGLQCIKDVQPGQKILSFDTETKTSEFREVFDKFETVVVPENRLLIETSTGIQVKTSKLHPILTLNSKTGELFYKKAGELLPGDCLIQPEDKLETFSPLCPEPGSTQANLGWFIGAHIGDGTAGKIKTKYSTAKRSWYVDRIRIRILGDNLSVVKKYGEIANGICGSKSQAFRKSTNKNYKSEVWEYCLQTKKVKKLTQKYFDGQIGQKVYSAKTPSFVKKNNLWIPYIAGLIDTDGYVRQEGTIYLSICAKEVVDEVASWLSAMGVRTKISVYLPKRPNEKPIWKLAICDKKHFVVSEIIKHMTHEDKKARLSSRTDREFSNVYLLTDLEKKSILTKYELGKYKTNFSQNLSACICLLKKSSTGVGIGALNVFNEFNLVSKETIRNIKQRVLVENITRDQESKKYFDLVVEKNNNFYAGNFGLVVDHNCGIDISSIRPRGMKTSNAAKTTDGIAVFMERFSNTCREVAQSGRRGAEMQTISVHHPEIETFINIKKDLKKVTGANISIRLTDEFMTAVSQDKEFELRWPVDSSAPKIKKLVNAKEIWDQIISAAWESAEPGLLFWDTAMRETPAHCYPDFISAAVNPCAELLLSPYDSCRLLLINALKFVQNPFTDKASFDMEAFAKACQVAQRLMDDLIDLELECIDRILKKIESDPESDDIKKVERELWEKIRKACANGRRTGLGLTAIGDTLASLNVVYGSQKSIEVVENIYKNHVLNAYMSSVNLAKERGSFPVFNYELEKNHPFINRIMDLDSKLKKDWKTFGRRNIALTTTAPAGSVSMLTQTTSGIEPAFQVVYKRRRKIMNNESENQVDFVDQLGDKWQEYDVYHHQFKKWMEITGKTKVEESPYWKGTANDIDWEASVDLQAAAQKWCCHAISKTCNLPNDASKELVARVYSKAWKAGCKGFTVYRDGCRSGVLVTEEKKSESAKNKFVDVHAPKRPQELECEVVSTTVNKEKWTFFVGLLNGRPYEIMGGLSKFVTIPKRIKSGKIVKHNGEENPVARYDFHYDHDRGPEDETIVKDISTMFENATNAAFTRTISLALRHGTPVRYIVEQLLKGSEKDDDLFSFSRAVSRVLKSYIQDGTVVTGKKCQNCSSESLAYQEGCLTCLACGNSKCS